MKLSKFFQEIELNDNIFAIFNSLMMDILYVDKDFLNLIKEFKVSDKEKKIY